MATRKRKKRRTKKAAAPRKSSPRAKRAPVDHTKDPVYKLKPNDIIEYTPYGGDGSEFPKEFHIIIEHTYERDPDRISSQPTLQLKDGRLIASTLYCWGDDACDITKLTDTHRLEMIIEDGQVSYKIVKKRKKRKAAWPELPALVLEKTPQHILEGMDFLGELIVSKGLIIATGNCKGADQAFAKGGNKVDPTKVWLFLPWHSYERDAIVEGNWTGSLYSSEMEKLAAKQHPAWEFLTPGVKKLMVRNAAIIDSARHGKRLVLGYLNPNKKGGGGTGHGWRIAQSCGLNFINLIDEAAIKSAEELIQRL